MEGYKEGALTEFTKKIKIDKNDQLDAKMFTYINGKVYPLIPKGKNPEIPSDKCRKVPKRKYPEIPKVPGQTEEIPKVPGRSEKVQKYPEIPKVERKRKKVKSVGDEEIKRAKLESPSEKEDVNETSTVTYTEDTKETMKRDTLNTNKLGKLARKRAKYEQILEGKKRTIFVGNIPNSTSKKEIEQIFCQYGKIQFVRLLETSKPDLKLSKKFPAIKKKFQNRHTLNAYVQFESQDSAEAALVHKGHVYNGFQLRVDRSTVMKPPKLEYKRSVYVENISYETDEETVRNHFSDCGEIEGVRIIRDRITGVGKGVGYVLFKSVDSVQLAIRMNEASFLEGRRIHVKRAAFRKTTEDAYGNEICTKNGLEPR